MQVQTAGREVIERVQHIGRNPGPAGVEHAA
jgi:hypothetical protein